MPATNPLEESMTKVTGLDPLSTTTGTSPITYDDTGGFRAPEGDVITISGDPGTGASQAETWGHELELAQQEFEALQFQYSQQQDLLSQQLASQQLALDQQAAALAQSQYGLSSAANQRAATMAPYEQEAAALANQQSALAVAEAQRKEQSYWNTYNAQNLANQQMSWLGGAPVTPESNQAWNNYVSSPYSQPGYQKPNSVYAYYGVPAGTNPYTGKYDNPQPLGLNGKPTQQIYYR